VVVHNGIIENYLAPQGEPAEAKGTPSARRPTRKSSPIWSKIIYNRLGDFEAAVRAALGSARRLRGGHPLRAGARQAHRRQARLSAGGGAGEGEYFVASDIPAMLSHTREMIFLEDGEMVVFTAAAACRSPTWWAIPCQNIQDDHLEPPHGRKRGVRTSCSRRSTSSRGPSPTPWRGASRRRRRIHLEGTWKRDEDLRALEKINIVACGTSWHAALVGKFLIEKLARVPVEVDIASEFRYRDPIVTPAP
jgi:glutamine---fructose-6-phosphate transaminase (isomerizing)